MRISFSFVWVAYLLMVNVVAFVLFGIDKRQARLARWRIPERRLMLVAALGGSVGAWAGMFFFRHKTRHRLFTWGVPALLLVQLAAACYVTSLL